MHRWERLFADLGAQLEGDEGAELDTEVAERTRVEQGRIRLVDRLRAASQPIGLRVGGALVRGVVVDVGPDWVLVATDRTGEPSPATSECLVALAAVQLVDGLPRHAREPGSEGEVASRYDLRAVLRALCRDREPLAVTLVDGSQLTARPERVGADHVEVSLVDGRDARVSQAIPISAFAVLRRV